VNHKHAAHINSTIQKALEWADRSADALNNSMPDVSISYAAVSQAFSQVAIAEIQYQELTSDH
jgi:hypothetical protein